jgi:hypothetical protein
MFALTTEIMAMVMLFIITLIYALFDVFNNRNVPTIFAYATLAVGVVFTFALGSFTLVAESAGITAVVLGLGYVVYKAGQIGAADIIEFASISLIMPVLLVPLLTSTYQFNIPFIVSVFINTGIAALVLIPVYYMPRASRVLKKPLSSFVTMGNVIKSTAITLAYVAFLFFLVFFAGGSVTLVGLIGIIMISSLVTVLFEKPITDSMVSFITPRYLEDQDIIAFNMMKREEVDRVRKKVRGFSKLANQKTIKKLRSSFPNLKLPVYRSAMPMALPIFIGTVVSLLVGNVLIYLF